MPRRPAPTADPSKIADLPSFKTMESYAAIIKVYAGIVRRISPIARLLGLNAAEHLLRAEEASKLASEVAGHLDLADRFNFLYVKRGWVAHGSMKHQALLDAIRLGEAGDCERGEEILASIYDEEHLTHTLMRMGSLEHFSDRLELATLAKEDYLAGRYHASVPVVLTLIDGLATDAAESNESFFSERANLTAWDSVEGHPTALPALKNAMCTPRQKRRTESIWIPHRHGILHGRDLGFANQVVAAKCWGTLFALGEWARRIEQGKRRAPPPEPQKGLLARWRSFTQQINNQQRWREWRSTSLRVGVDFPATGSIEDYRAGTPERLLVEFLTAWLRRDYGAMGKDASFGADVLSDSQKAGRVGKLFRPTRLDSFSIRAASHRAPTMVAFEVDLEVNARKLEVELHVVRENEDGDWLYADVGAGTWRLMNWETVGRNCFADSNRGC